MSQSVGVLTDNSACRPPKYRSPIDIHLPPYAADKLKVPAVVYRITNRTNGKTYIGVTRKTAEERFARHVWRSTYGDRGALANAIRKYGRDAFEVETIERCETLREAFRRERELIALHAPEYNLTKGGEGVVGLVFSAEARAKMSAAKKGRPCSWLNGPQDREIRAKISAAAKSRPPRVLTPEQIERARAHAKLMGGKNACAVRCIETGEIFPSMKEAECRFGISRGSMYFHLKTKSKMRCGLSFVRESAT